jgi:DNA-binding transcriptional LysR family regulator
MAAIDKRLWLLLDTDRLWMRQGARHRMAASVAADLRQMRYFVAVAEHGNFTHAADELHVAQQAVSQQVRALEKTLAVTLLRRTSRRVELTSAGTVFLADAKRVLAASDRAVRRVQAAARGEAGTLRLVYTLATAFETTPLLLELLEKRHPQLKVAAREVYGADVADLLLGGQCDLGLGPMTSYPQGLRQRLVRREVLRLAVSVRDPLAGADQVELSTLEDQRFELWPRQMSPGYYDVVVGACRAAGFEPTIDEHGAGATVWGYIAQGRGAGLVVGSLFEQLPPGIALIDLAPPRPTLAINAVWSDDGELPSVARFLDAAASLAAKRGWH